MRALPLFPEDGAGSGFGCEVVCTQELLSKHVESGQAHSIVPSVRAVLCFSISWPTIASTVSVVWRIHRSVIRV